jgi:hypothetical protein
MPEMKTSDYVLAVLAADADAHFSPVQLQKLFFLLERKVGSRVGGPHFTFRPYNYGPFDAQVYEEVERLEGVGLANIARPHFGPREFALNDRGKAAGLKVLIDHGLSGAMCEYFANVSKYVRSMSFQQLVSSVYREFPEMKARSIFHE